MDFPDVAPLLHLPRGNPSLDVRPLAADHAPRARVRDETRTMAPGDMKRARPAAASDGSEAALRRGLPMVRAIDPEALEKEKTHLREIDSRPGCLGAAGQATGAFPAPGGVQSALTLGAGSAGLSIYAGAMSVPPALGPDRGHDPGVVVVAAIGDQTLMKTGQA